MPHEKLRFEKTNELSLEFKKFSLPAACSIISYISLYEVSSVRRTLASGSMVVIGRKYEMLLE